MLTAVQRNRGFTRRILKFVLGRVGCCCCSSCIESVFAAVLSFCAFCRGMVIQSKNVRDARQNLKKTQKPGLQIQPYSPSQFVTTIQLNHQHRKGQICLLHP